MNRKALAKVFPLCLILLIVACGILLPRLMLDQQQAQLFKSEGSVKTSALAVYGKDEASVKALEERIAQLSQLISEVVDYGSSGRTMINDRNPLDTELTHSEAILAAVSYFQTVNELCGQYKLPPLLELPNQLNGPNKEEWLNKNTEAMLCISHDDAALSLWEIKIGNHFKILLDAVSGIPLYIINDDTSPTLWFNTPDLLCLTVAQSYNEPIFDSVQFAFPQVVTTYSEDYDFGDNILTSEYSNHSGAYMLNVIATVSKEGDLLQFEVRLSA